MTRAIDVDGMDSADEEQSVVEALEAIDGIDVADVDRETGRVAVEGSDDEIDVNMLVEVVEDLGYKATA